METCSPSTPPWMPGCRAVGCSPHAAPKIFHSACQLQAWLRHLRKHRVARLCPDL